MGIVEENSIIIIETQDNFMARTQHKEVRSFDHLITIEYVER